MKFVHKFVEHIPANLDKGVLYISIDTDVVIHLCACGCGEEVVTPLGPSEWCFIYDGKTVSLDPSIGNWSYTCKSHYWITNGEVVWARAYSKTEIAKERSKAKAFRKKYFQTRKMNSVGRNTLDNVLHDSDSKLPNGKKSKFCKEILSIFRKWI